MLRHVTIASGGVLPKIHPELIGRKKGNQFPNQVTAAPPAPATKAAASPVKKQAPAKKAAVAKGKVKKAGKQASPVSKAAASVGKTALLRKVYDNVNSRLCHAVKSITLCFLNLQ